MIAIVTDSGCDLPEELLRRFKIRVVPLSVTFGDQTFLAGVELENRGFYRMLSEAKELPKTSQPAAGDFLQVYQELTESSYEVLSIHMSEQLSGTLASARAAQQMMADGSKVSIVDSRSVSVGLGLIVLVAAEEAERGTSLDDVVALLGKMIAEMRIAFVVDTLENLHKGGRIGGASALIGTLLNIKPILCVKDGRIEPMDRVRSRRKAIHYLLDFMEAGTRDLTRPLLGVAHCMAEDDAAYVQRELKVRCPSDQVVLMEIGPIVATHGGPGLVGVAYCPDPRLPTAESAPAVRPGTWAR
jgi:DegV family protein with EDD domain